MTSFAAKASFAAKTVMLRAPKCTLTLAAFVRSRVDACAALAGMREILRAIVTSKPLITVLESEAKHGGLRHDEIYARLKQNGAPCEARHVTSRCAKRHRRHCRPYY